MYVNLMVETVKTFVTHLNIFPIQIKPGHTYGNVLRVHVLTRQVPYRGKIWQKQNLPIFFPAKI